MAKANNSAITPTASAPLAPVYEGFDPSQFTDVDLQRTWHQNTEGQGPTSFVVLGRSGDVSGLFESKFPQDKSPRFIYACELLVAVKASDKCLFRGGEPVDAPAGSTFYMFGKGNIAPLLHMSYTENMPIQIRAVEKKPIYSRKLKTQVFAWDVKARSIPGVRIRPTVKGFLMPGDDSFERDAASDDSPLTKAMVDEVNES